MKNTLPLIALLLLLPISGAFAADEDDQRTFRNNTGRSAYIILRTMPSEMREAFRKKMQRQYKNQWHKDMKILHQQMKGAAKIVQRELKKSKPSKRAIEKSFEGTEKEILNTVRTGSARLRSILAEVISEATPEARAEMAEELNEALEEWEKYKPRARSWWRFW